MPIDQVTQRDVASCLLAISQRGAVTTTQARSTLQAFYIWAIHMGIALTNPVIGTRKPREAIPRERVLSDDEVGRIWNGCGDDDYGRVIKLLTLTGSRRQEVGGMAWPEIDFERGLWTLPAARSKNGRAHTLPLPGLAFDIIKTVPCTASREHLFGSRSGTGFANWDKGKQALDARCGVTGWTVHDIRRSVATKLADIGVQPHVIEQILNHQSGHKRGIAGIYNRSSYGREVRAALALWADHVSTLVDGGERKIVPLLRAD
jgi:integrase